MANTSSAKKAVRSSARKKIINDRIRENFKEARKVVRKAIATGNKDEAMKAMPEVMKSVDKAAKKKVIHKNTAARYKSRLAQAINKLT